MRKCKKCGTEKPPEQFGTTGSDGQYRLNVCKTCVANRLKAWAKKNAKKRDAYRQRYYADNRVKIMARVREWEAANPERRRANAREFYYRLQHECIAAYGGYQCACCGETEPMFLSIDHVNDDGAEHRKLLGGNSAGVKLYQWLKAKGYPEGFQVLCLNCNFGRYRNGGVCPHKQGVTTSPKGRTAKRREAHRTPRG